MSKDEIFTKLKSLERRDLSFVERIKIKKFFESFFVEYFEEKLAIPNKENYTSQKEKKKFLNLLREDLLIMKYPQR